MQADYGAMLLFKRETGKEVTKLSWRPFGHVRLPVLLHRVGCKADGVEFVHVYEAYREQRDADRKDCKERARLMAEILIQLQLRKRVSPRQLLRLPWDYEPQERKATRRSPRPPRARKSLRRC
jgi:hypothetical protein